MINFVQQLKKESKGERKPDGTLLNPNVEQSESSHKTLKEYLNQKGLTQSKLASPSEADETSTRDWVSTSSRQTTEKRRGTQPPLDRQGISTENPSQGATTFEEAMAEAIKNGTLSKIAKEYEEQSEKETYQYSSLLDPANFGVEELPLGDTSVHKVSIVHDKFAITMHFTEFKNQEGQLRQPIKFDLHAQHTDTYAIYHARGSIDDFGTCSDFATAAHEPEKFESPGEIEGETKQIENEYRLILKEISEELIEFTYKPRLREPPTLGQSVVVTEALKKLQVPTQSSLKIRRIRLELLPEGSPAWVKSFAIITHEHLMQVIRANGFCWNTMQDLSAAVAAHQDKLEKLGQSLRG